MNNTCGQCRNSYHQQCQLQRFCDIHNGPCFQCSRCEENDLESYQMAESIYCKLCHRLCIYDEVYYDEKCSSYLCRRQFKGMVFVGGQEIELPCGCFEKQEKILEFMSQYCIHCSRKLSMPSPFELISCQICQRNAKQSPKIKRKSSESQFVPIFSFEQAYKYQLGDNPSDNKEILKLNDLLDIKKLQYRISELARNELKSIVLHKQRERHCPTCLVPFDSKLVKPFMICLKQHSMCEVCIKQKQHIKLCIYCKETAIDRSKIYVNRQRIKTLQFEQMISQKFTKKKKKFMEAIKREQHIFYKNCNAMKPFETQTDFVEEKIVEEVKKEQKQEQKIINKKESTSQKQKIRFLTFPKSEQIQKGKPATVTSLKMTKKDALKQKRIQKANKNNNNHEQIQY